MLSRLTVTILAASLCMVATASEESEDHDLIGLMGEMQYFAHKLDLSIRAQNRELLDFYAHEIEETLEATAGVAEYHGKPIGGLTKGMLVPAFERFEQAVDDEAGGWEAIDTLFNQLVDTCNACHQATGYGFINVVRTDANPYMQSFDKKP